MNKTTKILVVEDQFLTRKGIVNILEKNNEFYQVYEAESMKEAITKALKIKPEIILMDLQLGDGTGVEACRIIMADLPDTKVLFISMYDDETSVTAAILSGACGYIDKKSIQTSLSQAVTLTMQGFCILDHNAFPYLIKKLATKKIVNTHNPLIMLSDQQIKVVELLTKGLTNKEIGKIMGISDKTVRNYLSIIFEKLGISKRTEAAVLYTESNKT